MSKSRVLIIGATGKLGYHLAKASINGSHPTFALIRETAFSDPLKSEKINSLSDAGVHLFKGSLEDEKSLLEAVKQVDVVICSIPSKQVLAQKSLIHAIKLAGCVKRFIPSEFGSDPDKMQISDMDHNFYSRKAEIRRQVEAAGIPYTYICVFMKEVDVAAFTISTVDDPRTLNKALCLRPPGNVYSMNELVEIWENKIGKELEKEYVSEEELLTRIKETQYPDNMALVFIYSAFVKGHQTCYDIESAGGVDGTKLYPHLEYTTISQYLDTLV
ncbi:putative pinoresinol-lariciresinol reductase 3 [Bienertia sinuspersici]